MNTDGDRPRGRGRRRHPGARHLPAGAFRLAAGADDHIRNPFSPEELRARVQAILGRR
jgi:CheY-like chemotaxis protein